ncbi:MAG: sugar phosphate nucleotidyltransferase [Bacteroidota bacterium]|nr:sugar phosphate nucleotidyltransferase [Chlorobiota bacterium]MDW8075916.1 sugar phosphate nucleotidyltransferase [Bacteroidota bacterium]MDW8271734.1 sugar phosphate nucleotidyltransferase [Bacteroidota bacterium]
MHAVIPVAGYGTRLRPHTYTIPKVLLNVAGKPILAHILDALIRHQIERVTIVIGHMGEQIQQYVRMHYSQLTCDFVVQHEPLGLGHAIWCARTSFGTEPVFIILGDTIFDADLTALLQIPTSAIGIKAVDDPRRFGVVEVSGGMVVRLIEKPSEPPSNLAIVGLYVIRNTPLLLECLEHLIMRHTTTKGEFQLTDALQCMVEHGEQIAAFPVEGWYDCGKPETLLETNRFLLARNTQAVAPPCDSVVLPPSYVAPTAIVERSVIGPYATVGEGAIIRDSRIQNSIVGAGASVIAAVLDGSLIGNNAIVNGSFHSLNVGDSSQINYA